MGMYDPDPRCMYCKRYLPDKQATYKMCMRTAAVKANPEYSPALKCAAFHLDFKLYVRWWNNWEQ